MSDATPRILEGGREWLTTFVQDFGAVIHWSKDQVSIFVDSTKAAARSTATLTRRFSTRVTVGREPEQKLHERRKNR